jgi:hypothetical protein
LEGFGARDDHAIEAAIQKIADSEIEIVEMPLARIASRKLRERVEFERKWNVAGGGFEKIEELDFGVFQSGVRHVVDQRDSESVRVVFPTAHGSRGARAHLPRQKIRNSPSVDCDRHPRSPKSSSGLRRR